MIVYYLYDMVYLLVHGHKKEVQQSNNNLKHYEIIGR